MTGFLRTIIIIVIVYYIFKFFMKYIFPALLGNFIKQRMSEMQSKSGNNTNPQSRYEGETVLKNKDKANKKHFAKDSGEYIDYEEVKE